MINHKQSLGSETVKACPIWVTSKKTPLISYIINIDSTLVQSHRITTLNQCRPNIRCYWSKYRKLLSSIDTHQCQDLHGITILKPVGVGSLYRYWRCYWYHASFTNILSHFSSLPSQGVTYQMGDHVKADYSVLRIRICCIQVLDFIIVSALERGYKHGNVGILLLPVQLF